MENTKKCTICRNLFDADDAAILTMSGYGNARYICPECSSLLDVVTLGDNYDAIKSAMDEIGQKMAIDVDDTAAVTAFSDIMGDAAIRAEKIKNGEYDFSLDSEAEESFEEIPEDLKESEEDRALDEKEAKERAVFDKISSWVCGGILLGAVIYLIISMIK